MWCLHLVMFTFKLYHNGIVNRQLQYFQQTVLYWDVEDLELTLPIGDYVIFILNFDCWHSGGGSAGSTGPLVPYGLPCVRELLRFLVSLTNSVDGHNTDVMIQMGLSLLTVALESGADHIALFKSLLTLVRDDMCKNLFFVSSSLLCITFKLWVY